MIQLYTHILLAIALEIAQYCSLISAMFAAIRKQYDRDYCERCTMFTTTPRSERLSSGTTTSYTRGRRQHSRQPNLSCGSRDQNQVHIIQFIVTLSAAVSAGHVANLILHLYTTCFRACKVMSTHLCDLSFASFFIQNSTIAIDVLKLLAKECNEGKIIRRQVQLYIVLV